MDIVTIDFETYYSKEFSLSKMTTEEYIRSPMFEVIGVGVKMNDDPAVWYTGDDPGSFLNSIDYSDKAILCHHTAFDGAILGWHFGIKPKLWLDTLSMSRPLHKSEVGGSLKKLAEYYHLGAKGTEVIMALGKHRADFTPSEMVRYGNYCINDVELTHALFNKLKPSFTTDEIMVIDQTIRMYTEPKMVLDVPKLTAYLKEVQENKTTLVEDMGLNCTEDEAKKILMSNPKFADYLRTMGVDPPTKVSKATGKEAYAFAKSDAGFKALLMHPIDRVRVAANARIGVKSTIEETRTKRLISIGERGALPIMLNYYGAHTGRFSGGDKINAQNFKRGGTIRDSICPPPGYTLVACDSSQIEARMLAWLANQNDLLEAFREGRDVYSEFASAVYGRLVTKADTVDRFVGKTSILGLGYQMGGPRFQETLRIGNGGISVNMDMNEAYSVVNKYRAKNYNISSLWDEAGRMLETMTKGGSGMLRDKLAFGSDHITLPSGFPIKYSMLTVRRDDNNKTGVGYAYLASPNEHRKAIAVKMKGEDIAQATCFNWTHIYGGKVIENVTQALARIVVSKQGITIGQRYPIVLQVHDELVACVPDAQAEECKAYMEQVMAIPPDWAPDLPVACEAAMGKTFGECK